MTNLTHVFETFDGALSDCERVLVAYSGGKDSTAMTLMLYDWIVSRNREDFEVVLINTDTLSEIPEIRAWAKCFMDEMVERFREIGVESSYMITSPKPTETFYWRVLIRGYPAPTHSFRWCVELLKRRPFRCVKIAENSVVLLGHRDDESSTRARAMKQRINSKANNLQVENNLRKLYPIRSLSEKAVWSYLRDKNSRGEVSLDPLFKLYRHGEVRVRYGCWHCTLVKYQMGHHTLGGGYFYMEVGRLIYRWLSDLPELRARKHKGYSRLGHLLPIARAIMLCLIEVIERLSGFRFYGLDESKIFGISLRKIFYELPPSEADDLIRNAECTYMSKERLCGVEELRSINDRSKLSRIINKMRAKAKKLESLREYSTVILDELETLIE